MNILKHLKTEFIRMRVCFCEDRGSVSVDKTTCEPRKLSKNKISPNKTVLGFFTTMLLAIAPNVWAVEEVATRTYPTTTQTVMKGYILASADLTTAEVGNLILPKSAVMDDSGLVGMEVTRPLRAGLPIPKESLRMPPQTYKGKTVTITLSQPGMEITTSGKALQDGYKGDNIRVFSNLNQKIINATVVAPGVVTVN